MQFLNPVQLKARRRILRRFTSSRYRLIEAACPFCGAEEATSVAERETYGLPIRVAVCLGCGLLYTKSRMDDATLRRYYDEDYRRLERGTPLASEAFVELQRSKGPIIRDFLAEAGFALPPGSLVAEIGCGAGGILANFRDAGYQVCGCDIGGEYLSYGRDKHGLELVPGGLEELAHHLGQTGRSPALILYEQVLEHLADPVGELQRLRRLFSATRAVFVGVPGLRNIDSHYNSDFARYLQAAHMTHLDLASLAAIAEKAGWQVTTGNEVVYALLSSTEQGRTRACRPNAPQETLRYLAALEERYQAKLRTGEAVEAVQLPEETVQQRLVAGAFGMLRHVPGARAAWRLLRGGFTS